MSAVKEKNGSYKHGMYGTKTYNTWAAMKRRCLNKKSSDYYKYGKRGIKLCNNWMKFEIFLKDMGKAPPHMTIDRIDTLGNYEPKNCRWASYKQQANNKRNNRLIKYKGLTRTLAQWADIFKISQGTLRARLDIYKWSIEKSFTAPLRKKQYV